AGADGDGGARTKAPDAAASSSAALSLRAKRPPVWHEVEEAMKEGEEALEKLRDRPPISPSKVSKSTRASKGSSEPGPKGRTGRNVSQADDRVEEDSDGSFFDTN